MKNDDTSNSKGNRCSLQRTLGKEFTIFVPTSVENSKKIKSNSVLKKLARQFDYVLAKPGAEHCFTPERAKIGKCRRGFEATAIRRHNEHGSDQEQEDREHVFNLASVHIGAFDKPILLDVNDNVVVYGLNCKKEVNLRPTAE